jgi:battenin
VAIGGFIVVAFASEEWILLTGVAMTSFASGLGEPTFLAMSAFYDKNVISTWSSGTGGKFFLQIMNFSILNNFIFY